MRTFGINYDSGFVGRGTTTHEPFETAVVEREMRVIRQDLRCDAVRITGGDADRLEAAANAAAAAGLEVWYSPFTNDLSATELRSFLLDAAERAERLRQSGASIVLLAGSEISLFNGTFLPGRTHQERLAALTDPALRPTAIPEARRRLNEFLTDIVRETRARFQGAVGYASLPFEAVDWTPFDVIASDAGYVDATSGPGFESGLRALTGQGKPFAVTEFGCAPVPGAAALGSRSGDFIEWAEDGRPLRMTAEMARDEQEQARYLLDLLRLFEAGGVDAAFVYTFARWDLPASDDAERDFDRASFGIVKVLPPGRTATAYPGLPWEPKAAFHALAEYGSRRSEVTPRRG